MTTRYRSNSPRFVDETIDDEALIMDMARGYYYSCAGASAAAWNALKRGASPEELAASLAAAYGVPATQVSDDVQRFVATLVEHGLLVESDLAPDETPPGAGAGAGDGSDGPGAAVPGPVGAYEGLHLQEHSDLADLILLDPVHDVSEAGWPHTAE